MAKLDSRPKTKAQALFDDYILELSVLQRAAHNLGLHGSARHIQNAITQAGWDRIHNLNIEHGHAEMRAGKKLPRPKADRCSECEAWTGQVHRPYCSKRRKKNGRKKKA